ncbi:MAG: sulfotransferase family protein [Candidatus Electrothrix sp. MAN1_4]|nr:sulfotransferase family protein [Candidatus Electrothrix sp. MAN1_4]
MWKILDLFKRNKGREPIYIVSGLPRSGTSMMMKMLVAGGMEPVKDDLRKADEDNPKGYYEFERVKKLNEGDTAWLDEARGKVVKVISALLPHLPETYEYRIIFMRRHMAEILASQQKMLIRRGEDPAKVDNDKMAALFEKHLGDTFAWLKSQENVTSKTISYNELLKDPSGLILEVNRFFGNILDEAEMGRIIDPNLYRQKNVKK